jgi:hypothetical protein
MLRIDEEVGHPKGGFVDLEIQCSLLERTLYYSVALVLVLVRDQELALWVKAVSTVPQAGHISLARHGH